MVYPLARIARYREHAITAGEVAWVRRMIVPTS